MPKVHNLRQAPNFPNLEEEILKFWQDTHAFEKSVDQRDRNRSYIFYDGPPFATGLPHYGHLLASTTKDVVPRYWTMKGYRVERVWGWDCHGLPIENMIEKKLGIKGGKKGIEELGIDKFNDACRAEVLMLDKEWEKIIDRLGRWVDFKHNYKTMDTSYMESVWWGFSQLYNKGLVYEGKKVILYCPRCATPLSNFEIAMDNSYIDVTEPSNTYKYKLKGHKDTYLLAWSTTPWNKLATPALAVNPDLEYVKVKQGDEFYILASTTLSMLKDEPYKVAEKYTGKELTQFEFEPHYDFYPNRKKGEKFGVVIADDFVTAEEGTGIVTLAIYGEEDYKVMTKYNIQLIEHVDEEGRLKPEVTPWAGMKILEVNPYVNKDLESRNLMYGETSHTHSVATCYRCATRLYYAPLPAWFIDVQQLKKDLIQQNEKINWFPDYLKYGRFGKGLETAPDWNVSRSRYWGTPMPIWQADGANGQTQLRVVDSIAELKKWAVDPKQTEQLTDIHREFLDDIELWIDDKKTIKGKRVKEVFDCWVESGSMPFASRHYPFAHKEEFERTYPAQFVSEYIAQTRAWFYTMHVMSVGIFGKPSFENVLTTGTILAEDGSKMSKSKKNYPDPMLIINEYGVDSLRLYLMSSPVMKSENLNFSEKEVSDIRKKVFLIWWNVYSFYRQCNTPDSFEPNRPVKPEHVMDRWLLSRLHSLTQEVTKQMDGYNLLKASRILMDFVSELSTWYLRRSRDRLRQAQSDDEVVHCFGFALYTLAQLFAPITPFFSELIYHNLVDETKSIHHTDWPKVHAKLIDETLEAEMSLVRDLAEKILAQRALSGLKVRQPLNTVTISSPGAQLSDDTLEVLLEEVNIKHARWQPGETIEVQIDTVITPELQREGEARELIRSIQQLRKKNNLTPETEIIVTAPAWPTEWEEKIKQATHTTEIKKGEQLHIHWS